MPTYQYTCPDCGNEFEKVQKFTDSPLKKCPTCGKAKVHRVVGRISVSFKGTGFYINDSKSASSTTIKKAEKDETPATTAESTATDSTAAPAAEAKTESSDTASAAAPAKVEKTAADEAKPAKKTAKKK